MKRSDGVAIISIYHYFIAGMLLLGACCMIMVPLIVMAAASQDASGEPAVLIVAIVTAVAILVLLCLAALYVAIGWGTWHRKPWGRWGAIVLAALSLVAVPVGTIVGGLTLWYLFQPDVCAAFGERVSPAAK